MSPIETRRVGLVELDPVVYKQKAEAFANCLSGMAVYEETGGGTGGLTEVIRDNKVNSTAAEHERLRRAVSVARYGFDVLAAI